MKKTVLILLLISQYSWSQKSIDFENEDYYYISRSQHLKIELEDDQLKIENYNSEKAKYNTGNILYYANDLIHFDSFTEIEDIEAFTENGAEKIVVDHFETKDQFGGGIFFSDQQTINFVFPAVGKGAETTLNFKEKIKDPHFLGSFRFGTYVPTKSATFTVEVPKGVELGYKTFNIDAIDISFEKIEHKKKTTYIWTAKNIEQFRSNDKSLSILNYLPHIIVHIKNYTVKRKVIPVLNDVSDLYNWYASLANKVDEGNLTDVYRIANDLTIHLETDIEKAKTIFNWVQGNINYVAFEDGLGGFIPRGAESVCNKRYGDCKDMANLLYVMLNHVGIEAYRTWIGTRDRPYSYYEVPTPVVDNHMITTAIINGETVFLDATDSYVPYGMPSSFIQGKEALIGISDSEYKIIKVPIQEKEKSKTIIETEIFFKNDTVLAKSSRTMAGYDMVNFVQNAKFKKDDISQKEYLNSQFAIGNNKTKFSNIDFGELTTLNNTYTLRYELEIRNYARRIGSKIFLNLNLEKLLSKDIILFDNEKFGRKIKHKFIREYRTILNIPEGYELKYLPKNISNELDDYGFRFNYNQEGNKIILTQRIYINTIAIQNEDFEDYNNFIKSLLKVYKKSISLEKKE
jgi:transglutaminase-like putative cysteine protease